MKKSMMILAAAMVFVAVAYADQGVYKSGTITLAATATSGEAIVDLGEAGNETRDLSRVVAYHSAGNGTGTVAFVTYDIGVEGAVCSSGSLTNGVSYTGWPQYKYTQTNSVNVVTGDVALVVSDLITEARQYPVRYIKVKVTQPSFPLSNTYKFSVFAD